ncbi:phage/conjugal plasmid C-4 type zinc finger TraR family protein [Variovorax boronicumulans]|uniref:TraR/DksA C4-type zinc finger protein n=1 Tax=Variovorax boronicumulans TaxID=436515 RepID=UPI0027897A2B|nr:TraR/DksA C4-type zinc finger protein [Variovorax boronicumulans]MDP9990913.1 phage/conjugal plasmid C-4 type zinc finger TraR family protein [Variovorax boronicumulans]MDQ0002941.1 phage/conjugal plasmid C-4 type zinc finger TraR family protein [Variovorax boronicumulans]
MDEKFFELASELEQARRDEALRLFRERADSGPGRDVCDCGEDIPPARRLAAPSAIRCIACQTIFERTRKCLL